MKGVKGEELFLSAENKVGSLNEVVKLIKDSNINIRAIMASVVGNQAVFRLVTSDNAKAKECLKTLGKVESREVIIVEMTDEIGQLYKLTSKLKDANINLAHIYGTTVKPRTGSTIIFSSSDNDRALKTIAVL